MSGFNISEDETTKESIMTFSVRAVMGEDPVLIGDTLVMQV